MSGVATTQPFERQEAGLAPEGGRLDRPHQRARHAFVLAPTA